MPTLTLKNLPASLHRRLKARARVNRRSLNAEALACLQAAVAAERVDVDAFLARARLLRARAKGTLTDEELSRLKAEGRP